MTLSQLTQHLRPHLPFFNTATPTPTAQQLFADQGIFDYYDAGFIITTPERQIDIAWEKVHSFIAYQSPRYRHDLIWLGIVYKDENDEQQVLHINEMTAGWYIFLSEIADLFPMIPTHWWRNFNASQPFILYLKDKLIREHVLDNLIFNN
jgi:hypothetical protein